jgi:serine/threonine-protein kinase
MDSAPSTPEPADDSPLSGKQLGEYQLLRRLGRGGMSDVYLAEQKSLRRKVAFKVLKSDLAEDEAFVRRFHKEAQAAAALVHANIVQIHEVGCIDGVHYIAQEYVAGQSLAQYLARHGAVDIELAISIIFQVAAALGRAGDQGIIHRDIKPANIMLSSTGEVKVADFGLARISTDTEGVDATQVGITMGTPLYMSPEQAEGEAVDPRSDIYSLGVTAYQMLAGRPPFEGETALSIAVQHLKRDPEPLGDLRPGIPEPLAAMVHRMLEKEPSSRFQSAEELLKELRALEVEGMDISWPTEVTGPGGADWGKKAESRVAATQQLETLMKTSGEKSGRWFKLTSLALVAFLVAAALPQLLPPRPLLDIDVGRTAVDRKPTVEEQYVYASLTNKEDALMSVEKYFPADGPEGNPKNKRFAYLARQKLGDLYLQQEKLDQAMACYTELAGLGPEESLLQAFGLVGQINVHLRRGELEEVNEKIVTIAGLWWGLDQSIPVEVIRDLLQKLDPSLRDIFEDVLLEVLEANGSQ